MKTKQITVLASFILIFSIIACKSDSKNQDTESNLKQKTLEQADSNTFKGEFIHVDSAAVLKGNDFIYGVKMDETSKQLIAEVNSLKKDDYDVIDVIVQGQIQKNTAEGWDEIITITAIEKVFPPKPTQEENVIRYSSQKSE